MCLSRGFVRDESSSLPSLPEWLNNYFNWFNVPPQPPTAPLATIQLQHKTTLFLGFQCAQSYSSHLFLSEWSWQSCFCTEAILDLIGGFLGAGLGWRGEGMGSLGQCFGRITSKESPRTKMIRKMVRSLGRGFVSVCVHKGKAPHFPETITMPTWRQEANQVRSRAKSFNSHFESIMTDPWVLSARSTE